MAGIPSGPLLLVSPHLDDAILSCAALVHRAESIEVLTIFAGSPDPPQRGWWDERCGFENSTESMATRRREDAAAYAGTPHRLEYLELLELQHVPGRTTDDRDEIARAMRTWLGDRPTGTVALPAGAGCPMGRLARWRRRLRRETCSPPQHPDHVFVRDIGLEIVGDSSATALLYEELPYLWGGAADAEAANAAAAGGRRADRLEIDIDRERKAQRIAAYASQIPHISPDEGRLDDATILPPRERYWLLRASTSR
jgi:LmbE family N-acetylglucosaminyl deacetylase